MINHAFTLLLNKEPQGFIATGVYIDSGFIPVETSHDIERFRSAVLGSHNNSATVVNRGLAAIRLCHAPEYYKYITVFDPRTTYGLPAFCNSGLDLNQVVTASLSCRDLFTAGNTARFAEIWRADSTVKDRATAAILALIYSTHNRRT
jgi:hypothetical protein